MLQIAFFVGKVLFCLLLIKISTNTTLKNLVSHQPRHVTDSNLQRYFATDLK